MIKSLFLAWILLYPFLSIFIFCMFVYMAKKSPNKDITELFREMNKMLDDIYEISPKFASMLEYILGEALEGNIFPVLLFLLISCFIPVLRLFILDSILRN